NQTDDDVYNGDIGILTEIEDAEQSETHQTTLCVVFDSIPVYYTADNMPNITLAYCISIHKSQGSEYPIVIMPIISRQRNMLQRKLIYTGITRARQSLVLLGEMEAFRRGIETLEHHCRNTTLTKRLKERICGKENPML
ncbi:MAG: ATP-dependent RecD-like DNA helicase, partial [Erysipelotrichia bacterium]|nr:ATP-dependent RecD-like DNA helicase [Erysipelotrichia bacterium]